MCPLFIRRLMLIHHAHPRPRPRSRRGQTGQVLPIVALLLLAIVGMAALAIDGSNLYAQHRRLQADLDVTLKSVAARMYNVTPGTSPYTSTLVAAFQLGGTLLASDGYPNHLGTLTVSGLTTAGSSTCASDAGIRLCDPPTRGPFAAVSAVGANYVEGFLDQDVGGFFGGVLGLATLHLSVRAVARTGGYAEPYALIGLSQTAGCSIDVVGGTNTTLIVHGSTMSNDQACVGGSAGPEVFGSSNMTAISATTPMTGYGGTNYGVPPITDPFSPTNPTATTTVTPNVVLAPSDVPGGCWNEVVAYWETQGLTLTPTASSLPSAAQGTYYFYPATTVSTTAVQLDLSSSTLSKGSFYLMPGCDGSASGVPGVYDLSNNHSSGQASIASYNSVTFFDQSVLGTGHATFDLNAPTSGPYQGLALVQQRGYDANGNIVCPSSMATITFAGISAAPLIGGFDAPCANITGIGNATTLVRGVVVGNTVTVQGSADDIVTYDADLLPKDKGSTLVE